ncbi:thermonuclease family protein [Rhizobium leguminosarum]|uniref:thermonuclease family protein n=1 Tax=Rhizobium leguminosarum TaxID=384 RepID=UPI00143F886A|nr:thermonuclease family protein [Rhizobium leguminosarum]NKL21089.1 thermonuclease family protein [Rhizobium leguminosarum bv. viciae]NKL56795.1 thermonuclease family protein [Rhizobium leguminosarum bv. viciae]
MKRYLAAAVLAAFVQPATAADLVKSPIIASRQYAPVYQYPIYKGRVAVMDGRTLWYPQYAQRVRLVDIDACELPQWALDPKWGNRERQKGPSPVPCGPLSKAWLKRTVGNRPVECSVVAYGHDGIPQARCTARGRDLAAEMLRVGWARVASPASSQYLAYQNRAMAARYGMWATYVLDMNEWRRKAVDKTLDRRPIADFNLLAERESEISPPFLDARRKPKRTDR